MKMLIKFLKKHWGLCAMLPLFIAFFLAPFFKGLHADHAVHALMAENFRFHQNLYYWGQNRLGSLIPMVAAPFQNLGLPSIWAAACSQLLLVLATYYFFQRHFKRASYKAFLAITLLLPVYPFLMQTMIGHPYLAQLFFTGAYLSLPISKNMGSRWQALSLPLLMAGSIWSSELALVGVAAFSLTYFKYCQNILKRHYIIILLASILGLAFLYYAKAKAFHLEEYDQTFASLSEIEETIKYYSLQFWELLSFTTNKPYNALLVYWLIISWVALIFFVPLKRLLGNNLFVYSSLAALGTACAVVLSHWAAIMDRPYNYFIPAYFFLVLALFSGWQLYVPLKKASLVRWPSIFPASYALLHVIASVTFIYLQPLKVTGRIDKNEASALAKQLESEVGNKQIGFLGTYWNAYLVDAYSAQILAMPCEGYQVRSFENYYKIFNRPVVFLRNGCLPELADTIYQHRQTLLKISPVYKMDTLEYAFYKSVAVTSE